MVQLLTTKYYFAYGSNLHLKQMKRRCPNSKFIGSARLANHRWHINERGYANVLPAEGHWVNGLVYEIDADDEAKLDINEGVSKKAYEKRHKAVLLHRAPSVLYRQPTAWIVDQGGPAKILRSSSQERQQKIQGPEYWQTNVLIYISSCYVRDSEPKEEYIDRINWGVADAQALGVQDGYIQSYVRPYVPATTTKSSIAPTEVIDNSVLVEQGKSAEKPATKTVSRASSSRFQNSAAIPTDQLHLAARERWRSPGGQSMI